MKIKNFEELATNPGRRALLSIVEEGFKSIDTEMAISSRVFVRAGVLNINEDKIPLAEVKRIFFVGVGKCALDSGAVFERLLGARLTGGIVIDVRDGDGMLRKIESYKGTHPFPSDGNVDVTKKIINLLSDLKEDDLVIFVISGGGSVLLCQPSNTSCQEEYAIMKELMSKGATIQEVNTIRKHLSSARGGFLAKYAYPAHSVALIFSDVPGNEIGFIASGPTVRDHTTVADAIEIAGHYGLNAKTGFDFKNMIETPKESKYFERVSNVLFLSNETALSAMKEKAGELGFQTEIRSSHITGEARVVGRNIIEEVADSPKNTVHLYAGETTVTIKGHGKGGRNQELALGALSSVGEGQYLASVASDGVDNSPYAGAICDTIGKRRSEKLNLDIDEFLKNNDSSSFFEKTGSCLKTGHTGSNVSDFIVAINI